MPDNRFQSGVSWILNNHPIGCLYILSVIIGTLELQNDISIVVPLLDKKYVKSLWLAVDGIHYAVASKKEFQLNLTNLLLKLTI